MAKFVFLVTSLTILAPFIEQFLSFPSHFMSLLSYMKFFSTPIWGLGHSLLILDSRIGWYGYTAMSVIIDLLHIFFC